MADAYLQLELLVTHFIIITYQSAMIDNSLMQKIELFLSCRKLYDQDVFSKSDPYLKISFKPNFNTPSYVGLGKTQTINNELNPNFKKSFIIDYLFESRQDIKFDVFDDDGKGDKDDYIGFVQTTVGNLMGAKDQTSVLDLKNLETKGKSAGKLIVRCQKVIDSNRFMFFKLRAEKLENVDSWFDFWDKSDPYLKFMKVRNDNTAVEAARTEYIVDNLNPQWKPIEINENRLINPSHQGFRLQCWDWEESGKDQFIGEAKVSIGELKSGAVIQLHNPKVKKPGRIILDVFNIVVKPSFVDYLRGGLQLNMNVAVDFTASNGTPKSASSLHAMLASQPNQYQLAIHGITQILLNYDYDKRIPAFGFGGKPLGSTETSHCFPLSGNVNEIQAAGVQHFMQMYKAAIENVSLSGPTYFGPIIQNAMKFANGCKQGGQMAYVVVLILTDGQIHDMSQTKDLLIECCALPISFIIVGVGNADFSKMNELDGDNGVLYGSNGKKAMRDIVQFVPFRDVQLNADILAKQLLAELPAQVVQYMTCMGIPPGKFQKHVA